MINNLFIFFTVGVSTDLSKEVLEQTISSFMNEVVCNIEESKLWIQKDLDFRKHKIDNLEIKGICDMNRINKIEYDTKLNNDENQILEFLLIGKNKFEVSLTGKEFKGLINFSVDQYFKGNKMEIKYNEDKICVKFLDFSENMRFFVTSCNLISFEIQEHKYKDCSTFEDYEEGCNEWMKDTCEWLLYRGVGSFFMKHGNKLNGDLKAQFCKDI